MTRASWPRNSNTKPRSEFKPYPALLISNWFPSCPQDEFMMHEHPVISLSFSRDSELIATGDTSGGCKV